MTVTEHRSLLAETTVLPDHDSPLASVGAVFDTTELRWFVSGPVPSDISEWFAGPTGVHEQRCDAYLVDGSVGGRSDIGLKRRFGETLELKIRLSLGETLHLANDPEGAGSPGAGSVGGGSFGGDLHGVVEGWRRWSPVERRAAERLVPPGRASRWIDIHKSIIKRRFSGDGGEVAFAFGAPATGGGCDIEIAEISVGDHQWWTFALAAFGPLATRQDALLASWGGLVAASGRPPSSASRTSHAMGYPEWLALTASNAVPTPHAPSSLLGSP